jgi:hypothetical protein
MLHSHKILYQEKIQMEEVTGRGKRSTNRIGEISESAIATRFLQLGYEIFTPYGGNQRYDMVIGRRWRIVACAVQDGTHRRQWNSCCI